MRNDRLYSSAKSGKELGRYSLLLAITVRGFNGTSCLQGMQIVYERLGRNITMNHSSEGPLYVQIKIFK
jgi:hypothetical protein